MAPAGTFPAVGPVEKEAKRTVCWRYIALIVGCLCKLFAGSIFSFNVYSVSFKKTFNYTQSEGTCALYIYHKLVNFA